jgi:uncharacterized membrane protein YcgQ (UPF0703/DUF1980 family)
LGNRFEEAILCPKTKLLLAAIVAHNSFSLLQSRISSLKKVSLTSQAVALIAALPVNNKTVVASTVVAAATNNAKCMMQPVHLAAYQPKFLSVQVAIVLYIAEIATAKTTADVTRMSQSPAKRQGIFYFLY